MVIATAGSRKTEGIIEAALGVVDDPVLITTFTNENRRQILRRINDHAGSLPPNVTVMTWFSFLLAHGARPYQRALTGEPGRIRGLNFVGEAGRYIPRTNIDQYYFDRNGDMYRDGVADFVCRVDKESGGAVVSRLEKVFQHILIDEVQDLCGYDLEVLDLLFDCHIAVTAVGDPRQHTLSTNRGSKNKKYRGSGLPIWFAERSATCEVEERTENFRCNQAICDFADSIYPDYPSTRSRLNKTTRHDGIFEVRPADVLDYYNDHRPVVLRYDRAVDTQGLPAMNIGVAKGSTFERVLIFPTRPMRQFFAHRDPTKLSAPEKLYVAVTRARHSVAFVIPDA